jgi:hypothetical protein
MWDDEFSAILRSGAERFAAAVNPSPPDVIRRRGDSLRRRKAVVSGVLVFVSAIGAGEAVRRLAASASRPPIGALPVETASYVRL